jgi:glycosyltransferase involved in cell wall biosynthesis
MISLVLATYNRFDELTIFLNSLLHSMVVFEVIIVDQNDILNLDSIISKYINKGLDIHHIKIKEKNLSNARNIGIANAKYDIIGFPDDDCFYEAETIKNIVNEFERQNADIIIGKWVEYEFKYSDHIKVISTRDILSFKSCPFSSISIFAKKNVLNTLNGFDTRLGVGQWYGSGEETDLIIRTTQKLSKIIFAPNVRVHHEYNKFSKSGIQKYKQTISRSRGTGAVYSKNNLPIQVILRGLFSPLFKSLFCFSFSEILDNLCVFYGRVTGFTKWSNSTQ